MSEIIITLHSANGDVVTVYPVSALQNALNCFAAYVSDEKMVTMTYR